MEPVTSASRRLGIKSNQERATSGANHFTPCLMIHPPWPQCLGALLPDELFVSAPTSMARKHIPRRGTLSSAKGSRGLANSLHYRLGRRSRHLPMTNQLVKQAIRQPKFVVPLAVVVGAVILLGVTL